MLTRDQKQAMQFWVKRRIRDGELRCDDLARCTAEAAVY